MGFKKFIKKGIKPPEEETQEQNRITLSDLGYTVKDPNRIQKEKFAAYGQLAKDNKPKKFYAPPGYEDFARPQDESNDLNKSSLDGETTDSNEQGKSEKKKKRGLFGRKKVSKEDSADEVANPVPTYDPYAANTGTPNFNSDPYSMNNSERDNYNNTNAMPMSTNSQRDPYSSKYSDPYASFNSGNPNNRSTPSQSNNNSSSDSYSNTNSNSNINRDPYQSSYDTTNNDSYGDKNRIKDPYQGGYNRIVAPEPYGATTNTIQASEDPYSSSNLNSTRDNFNSTVAQDRRSPYEENRSPMHSRHATPGAPTSTGLISTSTRNQRVSPYSDLNNNNYVSEPTLSKAATYAAPTGAGNGRNPYASLQNDNYGNRKSMNPYANSNAGAAYGSDANTNFGGNPYGSAAPSVKDAYALRHTDTSLTTDLNRTSTNLNTAPANLSRVATSNLKQTNKNAYATDLDLNEPMNEYEDDLNADMISSRQQMQQLDKTGASDDILNSYGGDDNLNTFTFENQETGAYNEDLNADMDNHKGYQTFEEVQREEEGRQQEEEEGAVDELKQQIKFTKQSSIASTRNTLKMAQEAEMSGMNTLGLLGHQSEKLNNVERNLDLMKVQNSIADEKVSELQLLNRHLLAVHVSNPFNSKRRKRENEERMKMAKIQEKAMMEETNNDLLQSSKRIENAMNENGRNISDIRDRYEKKDIIGKAKRYQFENDEEDDEMEIELDRNLDKIGQISGRLKKLALATGDELNSQQDRIGRIEDTTDDLDIKIHVNTSRLAGIK